MVEIVNLRAARKAKARDQARAKADENAAKHGRSRAERNLDQARADQASRLHAAHERENPADPGDQE